jgi:20S proteasome alpha/beta subunit
MSIVAWDGKTVAADKRACIADAAMTTTKIWKMDDGLIVATTGDLSFGIAMLQWFNNGEEEKDWPPFQSTDDWARLIIFDPLTRPYCYERQPVRQVVEDPFMAWGCGREFALGAMAMGATAREAVEVACRFNVYCGNGIDAFDLK